MFFPQLLRYSLCSRANKIMLVCSKALRGAGFSPQPATRGLDFVVWRCGLRARPVRCGQCCGPSIRGAGRAAARARICQNMRGGVGWGGPNDIVAGRVLAQLFKPAFKMCTVSVSISWGIT